MHCTCITLTDIKIKKKYSHNLKLTNGQEPQLTFCPLPYWSHYI